MVGCPNMAAPIRNPDERGRGMEKDENRESQEDDAEATEDLEVSSEDAEGVAGGARISDADAFGRQP